LYAGIVIGLLIGLDGEFLRIRLKVVLEMNKRDAIYQKDANI